MAAGKTHAGTEGVIRAIAPSMIKPIITERATAKKILDRLRGNEQLEPNAPSLAFSR